MFGEVKDGGGGGYGAYLVVEDVRKTGIGEVTALQW